MLNTLIPLRQRIWPGLVEVSVRAFNDLCSEKHSSNLLGVDCTVGELRRLSTAGRNMYNSVPESNVNCLPYANHLLSANFDSYTCDTYVICESYVCVSYV